MILRQWDYGRDRRRTLDLPAVYRRLAAIKGHLRIELGAAINRKKTPDLVFEVLLEGAAP